jgi:hypothetical protein
MPPQVEVHGLRPQKKAWFYQILDSSGTVH